MMLLVWRNPVRVTRMTLPEDRRHMVGERLAELREKRALTLHELEELSGVGADGISKIENGHRKPRPATLRKLARALGIEVEDFFREPAAPLAEAPDTGQEESSVIALVHDAALQEDKASQQANNRAEESRRPQVRFAHAENAVMPLLLGRLKDELAEAAFEFALLAVRRDRQLTQSEENNARLKEEMARLKEENAELRAVAKRVEAEKA
jgi:transcriptional regulator with XRE-family HTH domain